MSSSPFIPPPTQQVLSHKPWRGSFVIYRIQVPEEGNIQSLQVTAIETDGDNEQERWPPRLFVQVVEGSSTLQGVHDWVQHHTPPLCTFIPEHLQNTNLNTTNQTAFGSLLQYLFEKKTIAIAPWGTDNILGAGVIIYPDASGSFLLGALFLMNAFPPFVLACQLDTYADANNQSDQFRRSYQAIVYPESDLRTRNEDDETPIE